MPNCDTELTYVAVSKQLIGTQNLEGLQEIEWRKEQLEPVKRMCPECGEEIPDETLEEWGLG